MARGQRAASRGSWVTSRMVWPRWFSSPKSRMISSPVALSRLPVGSSASSRDGFPTSARAMATRCRWPPESSLGLWCMRFPSPTDSSAFTACSFRSLRGRPRYTSGSSTLASAVERESSWKVWKTKPISVLRRSASWSSLIFSTSLPLIRYEPLVGVSSAPMRFMSVDLPEPDCPTTATHSPRRTSKETPSRARTSSSPTL